MLKYYMTYIVSCSGSSGLWTAFYQLFVFCWLIFPDYHCVISQPSTMSITDWPRLFVCYHRNGTGRMLLVPCSTYPVTEVPLTGGRLPLPVVMRNIRVATWLVVQLPTSLFAISTRKTWEVISALLPITTGQGRRPLHWKKVFDFNIGPPSELGPSLEIY